MSNSSKSITKRDANDVLKYAFNEEGRTLAIDGFLAGKVGHKITLALSTTSVSDDTETYTFSDNGTDLFALKIIYTDGTRQVMSSAERIS